MGGSLKSQGSQSVLPHPPPPPIGSEALGGVPHLSELPPTPFKNDTIGKHGL